MSIMLSSINSGRSENAFVLQRQDINQSASHCDDYRHQLCLLCCLNAPLHTYETHTHELLLSCACARNTRHLQHQVQRLDDLFDLGLRDDLEISSDQRLRDLLDLRQSGLWHWWPHHGRLDETPEPDGRLVPDMQATDVLKYAASSISVPEIPLSQLCIKEMRMMTYHC